MCITSWGEYCEECDEDTCTCECGYWQTPQQNHKMCGECDSCTGYGDHIHEQEKDRRMMEDE